MPLEALRWPITPVGLHYLLIHYDVPLVDAGELPARGGRARSRTARRSTLDELRARPPVELAVDDGVRGQRPGPAGAPADQPAVADRGRRAPPRGAACRSRALLEEAGAVQRRRRRRLHRARPRSRGRASSSATSGACRSTRRRAPDVPPRVRDERRAAPAAARLPAPAGRPRLVRDDEREVAHADHAESRSRSPATRSRRRTASGRPRRRTGAGHADAATVADGAAGHPRLLHARPDRRAAVRTCSRDARGRAGRRSSASR